MSEVCAISYSFRQEKLLILANFSLCLISLLTLILLYVVYINREFRRIFSLVELDLKLIVVTGAIAYLISSISSFLFFGHQFVILMIDLSPCAYISNGFNCMVAQSFHASICMIANFLFFIGMFLERLYVFMGFNGRGFFGGIISLLIIILCPLPQLIITDESMYKNDRVYCGMVLTKLDPNVSFTAFEILIIDILGE